MYITRSIDLPEPVTEQGSMATGGACKESGLQGVHAGFELYLACPGGPIEET